MLFFNSPPPGLGSVWGCFFKIRIMKIEVIKIAESQNSTLSQMRVDGEFFCFVVEDGARPVKIAGETRIPAGVYKVSKRTHGGFYRRYTARWGHKFVAELEGVPEFSDILVHTGNTNADTRGCLLVADQAGRMGPDFVGTPGTSTPAYLRFYKAVERAFDEGEEVTVEVVR